MEEGGIAMRMQGKVAVVTGGASGIGQRTIERFVAEGGNAVVADIDEARGQRLAGDLGAAARVVRCDVTVEADIGAGVGMAVAAFGRLDLMYTNAGTGGDPSPIVSLTPEGWDATMNLLLRAPM